MSSFECDICLEEYNDTDNIPTSFPCGHACCLKHTAGLLTCHVCRAPLPETLTQSIALRDGAMQFAEMRKKLAPPPAEAMTSLALSDDEAEDDDGGEPDSSAGGKKRKKRKPKKKKPKTQPVATAAEATTAAYAAEIAAGVAGCAAAASARQASCAAATAAMVASATAVGGARVGPTAHSMISPALTVRENESAEFLPLKPGVQYATQFSQFILERSWLAHGMRTAQGLPEIDVSSPYARRNSMKRGIDLHHMFVFVGEILNKPTATADSHIFHVQAVDLDGNTATVVVDKRSETKLDLSTVQERRSICIYAGFKQKAKQGQMIVAISPNTTFVVPLGIYEIVDLAYKIKEANQVPCRCTGCESIGQICCEACLTFRYCTKECRLNHWPVHKNACQSKHQSSFCLLAVSLPGVFVAAWCAFGMGLENYIEILRFVRSM